MAFQKMQEKMQRQRIQQKAEMTHKQRVEQFNQRLDNLTEHFDIPKMGEEDEYACVNRAQLKIKDTTGIKKKKKKKSSKEKEKLIENEVKQQIQQQTTNTVVNTKTKAEMAFQKMQEKMQRQRIQQKAEMTHKQRVEKFNQHLDSLTEHFDIPKVSWTK
ncbi:hypothetical protein SFRURICE_008761 [Spodoptera frugiperda]|nr:hypothetical protein SFRURICE_008761 [Spodoptera frugiperda]